MDYKLININYKSAIPLQVCRVPLKKLNVKFSKCQKLKVEDCSEAAIVLMSTLSARCSGIVDLIPLVQTKNTSSWCYALERLQHGVRSV